MTIATTPTLLSMDRWAKIVGLNPLHWAGAIAGDFFPLTTHCDDIWAQYAHQTPEQMVSREEVAYQIAKAESDIKEMLGYSPAPDWEWREQHPYPGGRTRFPSRFALDWGKIIAPGVRGATVIEEGAEVIFTDVDSDGFEETATITVSTTVTDIREVKLFFANNEGLPEFEIRPLRKVVIDPDADTAVITADAWLFIDPDLWNAVPGSDENQPIDITQNDTLVGAVDVYRIYNDHTAFGLNALIAKPGTFASGFCSFCGYGTCANCGSTTQGGTFSIWDNHQSFVIPYPASYSDGAWRGESYADCGVPIIAQFYYYAGNEDKRWLQSKTLDPLSNFWADTIAWLAAARLPRGVCGCDNVRQRFYENGQDLTQNTPTAAYFHAEKMDIFNSALGTRVGEVRAWQAVTRIVGDQVVAGGSL